MAWLWESEKELDSTIIRLYWKQWHQTDEIMNSSVSNPDQAALKGPGVWAAQGRDWFDHEEALYLHPLELSLGKNIVKVFQYLLPFGKLFHYEDSVFASHELLTKFSSQCPWESPHMSPRSESPWNCAYKGLGSDLHRVWLASVGRSGSVAGILEMVVNIYGSMKVKINNAMSQVDIPLAKSQTSFFRQGK